MAIAYAAPEITDPEMTAKINAVKEKIVDRFLRLPGANVVGVGIGFKHEGGRRLNTPCVRVYVSRKLHRDNLTLRQFIDPVIDGVETDIIDVGSPFSPTRRLARRRVAEDDRPGLFEPGSSIGLKFEHTKHLGRVVSGTLGALFTSEDGSTYLLSCNHVLAVNGLVNRKKGEKPGHIQNNAIVSPSTQDRGSPAPEVIARKTYFVPLSATEKNKADCAIAQVDEPMDDKKRMFRRDRRPIKVENVIPRRPDDQSIGLEDMVGRRVFKYGKTSGETHGTIVDVNADIMVDYSFGTFHFTGQILIEGDGGQPFAADGDSGAVVLLDQDEPVAVGMVFAPAGRLTAACSFPDIIAGLEKVKAGGGGDTTKPQPATKALNEMFSFMARPKKRKHVGTVKSA